MKKILASFLFLALLTSLSLSEPKKNLIKKTGEKIGAVKDKITEPIRDPKAAFRNWFDFDPRLETGEKKNFNILPLFVSSPERGLGFGLKFAEASLLRKNDVIRLQAIQTLKNKSAYRIKYELPPQMFAKVGGEIELAYENYARFYYGIGNQTSKENESEYTPELFETSLPLLYGISKKIALGLSLNFQRWEIKEIGPSGILQQDLPGLFGKDGAQLYTSSFLVRWDTRNSKTDPSQGIFLESSFDYVYQVTRREEDYSRTTLDIRGFYPWLQNPYHVFAVRLYLNYKKEETPFFVLPELGGIFFNRGLIEGRFRDTLSVTGNWEYRLKIYQRLHWAFFVDAGNVYREFNAVTFTRTKITGGTGMRYYIPPGNLLLARVDGGYSTEGLQIYLTFDHPF